MASMFEGKKVFFEDEGSLSGQTHLLVVTGVERTGSSPSKTRFEILLSDNYAIDHGGEWVSKMDGFHFLSVERQVGTHRGYNGAVYSNPLLDYSFFFDSLDRRAEFPVSSDSQFMVIPGNRIVYPFRALGAFPFYEFKMHPARGLDELTEKEMLFWVAGKVLGVNPNLRHERISDEKHEMPPELRGYPIEQPVI